ncbi:MAG: hypothetical protein ACFFCR_15970 [Promethearchaeota archaeon]
MLDEGLMDEKHLDEVLSPEKMTRAGLPGHDHSQES